MKYFLKAMYYRVKFVHRSFLVKNVKDKTWSLMLFYHQFLASYKLRRYKLRIIRQEM